MQESAAPGRPAAESGHSGVQEEETALRQRAVERGEAEASPASELGGKDARVRLLAGGGRRGCPG